MSYRGIPVAWWFGTLVSLMFSQISQAGDVNLRVQREGDHIIARWPADAGEFFLQVSTNLNNSVVWKNADAIAVTTDGGDCCATIDVGNSTRFFRLKSWNVLFDGTSTDAFRGYRQMSFPTSQWTITPNRELKSIAGSGPSHIVTKDQYDDFELVWEWKTGANGNSGVMIRVTEAYSDAYMSGPEYQLVDDAHYSLDPRQSTGAAYNLIAPINRLSKPTGEWNQCRILVQANHVEHWLNGIRVVSYDLNSPVFTSLVANSNFGSYSQFGKAPKGYIAFQDWTPEVWFRNIKIRALTTGL